jgi:hypothetical protein
VLAEFDADGDGELSEEECAAAREAHRAEREARRETRLAELLAEFDADGDGELNEEERAAAHAARQAELLAQFDADGDGVLNEEERAAARAARCAARDVDDEEAEGEAFLLEKALSSEFTRADANTDGTLDIADPIFTLTYFFANGPEPRCFDAADANDDGAVDIADAIASLGHLFARTGDLPEPFGTCGVDPGLDTLGCIEYTHCR